MPLFKNGKFQRTRTRRHLLAILALFYVAKKIISVGVISEIYTVVLPAVLDDIADFHICTLGQYEKSFILYAFRAISEVEVSVKLFCVAPKVRDFE